MTVDHRDIDTIFLSLLGRLPESDMAYARAAEAAGIEALARRVMAAPEFRRNLQRVAPLVPPPDLPPCEAERLVFLHVPKCGGSTLFQLLRDWYGVNRQAILTPYRRPKMTPLERRGSWPDAV